MTLHTPGEQEARTTEALSAAHDEITSLRRAIATFTKKVKAGEDVTKTEARSAMSALSELMRNCIKLEVQIGELKSSRSDIAQGGYAIDHDAARAEIRCALGRVRLCCGAGAVFE
jgi:hypothetical protein